MAEFPILSDLAINGFRLFKEFRVKVGTLEVLVGANGSGKSSFFEFLRIFRKGMDQEIPPGIVSRGAGQMVFGSSQKEIFEWRMEVSPPQGVSWIYKGGLIGPKGNPTVIWERFFTSDEGNPMLVSMDRGVFTSEEGMPKLLSIDHGRGGFAVTSDPEEDRTLVKLRDIPNRFALSFMNSPNFGLSYAMKEYIAGWRDYRSFSIANSKITRPVLVEQTPTLREDCGNLSSVLHYFATEHREILEELEQLLRLVIPGFSNMTVKALGSPGEVMAFWREEGVDADLTLADLSDGILRFLCWAVLCLHPKPPTLICIDEPELGLHPRVLPLLAGLFQKASQRTQVLIATHSSYFLSQFPLESIAVMRKEEGRAVWIKPGDSKILRAQLEQFGQEEIEFLHRSTELEERA